MANSDKPGQETIDNYWTISTATDHSDEFQPIQWLWPGHIPRGSVTALIAVPGSSKSTLAHHLCHTLLAGGTWPDGQPCEALPEGEKLLWIDTRNDLPAFHERLRSWNTPSDNIIQPYNYDCKFNPHSRDAIDWLCNVIEEFRPPLVVIDHLPVVKRPAKGETTTEDVMDVLTVLAKANNIAIVVIHHLHSGAPHSPIHINRCPHDITVDCTSVLTVTTPSQEDPHQRRLDVIKSGFGPPPQPLCFNYSDTGLCFTEPPVKPNSTTMVDKAVEFLKEVLTPGHMTSADLLQKAAERGISPNALQRAREMTGARSRRNGDYWCTFLPGHDKTRPWNSQDPTTSDTTCPTENSNPQTEIP